MSNGFNADCGSLMILGRRMMGDAPTETDPKITFELEAETGETFEVSFSLRGILSTVVMAQNWPPLKEEARST
jgi:hypothetical protein